MFKALKKILTAEPPTAMSEAERELREAEREFLIVSSRVEYYIALSECHDARIRRLRMVLKTQDVLEMPDYEEELLSQKSLH